MLSWAQDEVLGKGWVRMGKKKDNVWLGCMFLRKWRGEGKDERRWDGMRWESNDLASEGHLIARIHPK